MLYISYKLLCYPYHVTITNQSINQSGIFAILQTYYYCAVLLVSENRSNQQNSVVHQLSDRCLRGYHCCAGCSRHHVHIEGQVHGAVHMYPSAQADSRQTK